MSIVNAGRTGSFRVDSKFIYSTVQDSVIAGAYPGNITLHTTGTVTIAANGTWNYNGAVRTYNDKYDANASSHRGALGEASTTVLRYMYGKEYQSNIHGDKVSGSGRR